ncbi:MAG: hypothetical protein J0H39_13780 [Alphaproteobacteria bacterium]|nr:hypothetical protein [Alphaproteobacteria bacterium]
MADVTLKPCPFCGGESLNQFWHMMGTDDGMVRVDKIQCMTCHAESSKAGWNTRPAPSPSAVEAVDALIAAQHVTDHEWVNGGLERANEARAAVLARLRGAAVPEWRDIKTAPKDGTPIIYLDARDCIGEAFWQDKDEHEPAWWDEANTETVAPLYWMPRAATPKPAAPKPEGG